MARESDEQSDSKLPADTDDAAPAANGSAPSSQRLGWLAAVAVGVAYFVLMAWLYPFRDVFEFCEDEGYTLCMVRCLMDGHGLYSEIWCDQPPVFRVAAAWWCELFGWEVDSVRVLALLFASLIVFGVYDAVRLTWGHAAALAGVLLLPASQYFMELSLSALIGLPAIAFAVLAMWALLRWAHRPSIGWLLVGGALIGLSVMTKLIMGFLLPVFGVWLLVVGYVRRDAQRTIWTAILPAAYWSAAAVVVCAAILLLVVSPSQLHQLYAGHVQAAKNATVVTGNELLWTNLRADWEIAVLAVIGLAQVALRRTWRLLIAPAWCAAALALLMGPSPVWYHYHLLLSVPACLTAGIAVDEGVRLKFRRRGDWRVISRFGLSVAAGLVAIVLIAELARGGKIRPGKVVGHPYVAEFRERCDRFAVALMREYAEQTKTVVTGREIYAVRTGAAVPPNLCMTGWKRWISNELTSDRIIETIKAYDPEQVVFAQYLYRQGRELPVVRAMRGRYRELYRHPGRDWIWVRSDVAGDTLARVIETAGRMPHAPAYDYIGQAWAARGKPDMAFEAFRRAAAIDPTFPAACNHLASAYMARGDFARGFDVLDAGRNTPVQSIRTINAKVCAWRRATCPDPKHRDGAGALRIMTELAKLQGGASPIDLRILASAHAAQGAFDRAVAVAAKAVQAARAAGQTAVARTMERELAAYKHGQAWVEPVIDPCRPRSAPRRQAGGS